MPYPTILSPTSYGHLSPKIRARPQKFERRNYTAQTVSAQWLRLTDTLSNASIAEPPFFQTGILN